MSACVGAGSVAGWARDSAPGVRRWLCAPVPGLLCPHEGGGREELSLGDRPADREPGASDRMEPGVRAESGSVDSGPGLTAERSGSCHCLSCLGVCSGRTPTHVPHLHEFCSAIGARAAAPASSGAWEGMLWPPGEHQGVGSLPFVTYFPGNWTRHQAFVSLWSSGVLAWALGFCPQGGR